MNSQELYNEIEELEMRANGNGWPDEQLESEKESLGIRVLADILDSLEDIKSKLDKHHD